MPKAQKAREKKKKKSEKVRNVYVQEGGAGGGRDPWRSLRQRQILDPVEEIFYVKKVVIALMFLSGRPIVGFVILENPSSFNLPCLFVATIIKVYLN